jgi:hypothetical protein
MLKTAAAGLAAAAVGAARPLDALNPIPAPAPGARCRPVTLVLVAAPPQPSLLGTTVSPYNGAPVTVRDAADVIIFAGFVPSTGRVIVGTVQSDADVSVTVGAVLQPVPFPGGAPDVDFVEMAGFTQEARVRCEPDGAAGLSQPAAILLRPPLGVIRGTVVASCAMPGTPSPGRTVELAVPPTADLPAGFLVAQTQTDASGQFLFTEVDPSAVYALRVVVGNVVAETTGVLAGAASTTLGTPGQPQQYLIGEAGGVLCNVLPDPP